MVNEADLLVGYGCSLVDGKRVRLEATASAGALAHHFTDGDGSGTRFDVVAALDLTGTVRVSRRLGVDLRVAPGASRTRYRHLSGNDLIWDGSWWRVEAGIGLVLF